MADGRDRPRRRAAVLLAVLVAAACSTPAPPPVLDRSPVRDAEATHYTVRSGDTLYSIAWRYGLDYRDLARHNDIAPPYRIHPSQRLSLRAQQPPAAAQRSAPARQPRAQQPPAAPAPPAAEPAVVSGGQAWQWPAQGRLVRDYGGANRGIDLELSPGSRVGAIAAGEVVYAGVGLRGYRHLVIIKHDSAYLSAYSLNDTIHVREGEHVRAGARLADITGSGRAAMLRFEIRRDGAPVNPRQLIERS
jgi:lipoprotein NlpD